MDNKKEKIGCPITLGEYERIMREDKEKLMNVKKLLKNCEFKHFYCNAIIFPRSIFDANIKSKETD